VSKSPTPSPRKVKVKRYWYIPAIAVLLILINVDQVQWDSKVSRTVAMVAFYLFVGFLALSGIAILAFKVFNQYSRHAQSDLKQQARRYKDASYLLFCLGLGVWLGCFITWEHEMLLLGGLLMLPAFPLYFMGENRSLGINHKETCNG
jgi:hypothetical protein